MCVILSVVCDAVLLFLTDNCQVLSGCGVYDGSEIHEASAYVWILSYSLSGEFCFFSI